MLKAINLLGMYVRDVQASIAFYTKLGFKVVKNDGDIAEVNLGDFRLQFVGSHTAENMDESFKKEAFGEPKGLGMYINIEVTDIDTFFHELQEKGIRPSTQPRDWPWGNREFVLRDLDRYKLVFYQRL
jgi:catechol 2,3-dioxygenase-like lactoylglutathione lyase family enzyme